MLARRLLRCLLALSAGATRNPKNRAEFHSIPLARMNDTTVCRESSFPVWSPYQLPFVVESIKADASKATEQMTESVRDRCTGEKTLLVPRHFSKDYLGTSIYRCAPGTLKDGGSPLRGEGERRAERNKYT